MIYETHTNNKHINTMVPTDDPNTPSTPTITQPPVNKSPYIPNNEVVVTLFTHCCNLDEINTVLVKPLLSLISPWLETAATHVAKEPLGIKGEEGISLEEQKNDFLHTVHCTVE
jgi:hypothetical protein